MAHEAGKGGKQRPTNHESFSSNYDLIWGKKATHDHRTQTDRAHGAAPQSGANNQSASNADSRAAGAHPSA